MGERKGSPGRYERRGVSSSKEEVHKALEGIDLGIAPGAFCKVLPDLLEGREDRALVVHADGAGTKSVIAYLAWKETGRVDFFEGIAQDASVMNIDDMFCVGAVGPFVLADTIGRNKALVPGEVIEAVIRGFNKFSEKLTSLGIGVFLAGGETADLGDAVRTIVVDAVCVAALPRKRIITFENVQPGDLIVGLASYGKASYEDSYNSGIGCNGLTSARHDLLESSYRDRFPETVCPETPQDLIYTGPYRLMDQLAGAELSVAQALLSPTRTYAPILNDIFREGADLIHGVIHCTGGGQTKCLRFGRNLRYIKEDLFPIPPIFQEIKRLSGASWREMYEVFNMGHRLEIITGKEGASLVLEKARLWEVEAKVIGRIERAQGGNELYIEGPEGTLNWEQRIT